MSSWLVTGGAGFIGSHIVERLVSLGENVRVLDDFSTGKRENLEAFSKQIKLMKGDIREQVVTRAACLGVDFVLHLAAQGSVPRSVKQPQRALEVNVMGTLNVLEAARAAGVKRVVISSSSSVYGRQVVDRQQEDLPTQPASPYALSKLASEHLGRLFTELHGLETISLRYFNVFGPRQDPNSQYAAVIPLFIDKVLKKETLTIHGEGYQSRDFTYVTNVVEANLLAAQVKRGEVGGSFNIACGESTSIMKLYKQIENLVGVAAEVSYVERRAGDIEHSQADIEKAQQELGYLPQVFFQEGLSKTIEWYKQANRLKVVG
jgi:UDP-N-acetylglucosamine 4-epimerase